ncbi:inter-alpha-trypsin inhibitor heavy chain H3-like [Thalassophryne amazonica]|uniref:inter-alpha-trypsin inhibitor heavy chain H3-like n=1 Tax=Thalassophryne amazonica TaxID=390379 RepID=UPI001471EF4D|nr:inter-alpha-trypsin inhibitor heavy chain H3-like [Thalassophryne amazonica]
MAVSLLWVCVGLWLPAQTQGALIISKRNALSQEAKGDEGARSIQMVEVYSITVDCTVTSRFAHTVMTSKVLNKGKSSQEVFFEVELPKTAFITNFSMEIDGKLYISEVKEKETAKKQYEKAVSSGQTAGLVRASGRKMEQFSVSVNIAAKSNVTFTLTYEELLQRKLGQYEVLIRVKPKQPVQEFQIVAHIYEPQGIAFLEASGTFLSNELFPLVQKTVMDTKAHVSFSTTLDQQRTCSGCEHTLIEGDFIIVYDVKRKRGLGDVQMANGYFVHFFAPPDLQRVPKNVIFVIDRSGSMDGRKMVQTHEALLAILKDLHQHDHFALIQFDYQIISWKKTLVKATPQNVSEAMTYVEKLSARGGTNINDAVLKAVHLLLKDRKKNKLPDRSVDMIILLTDGMPNEGVSNLGKIQENVRNAINGSMSLFCLGFGNNVDYSFLDVMSKQNKGLARRIYEASDATLQLQGFYDEVASPLLSDVDLRYPDNTVDVLTTNHFNQLFNGSEIVVAGQMRDSDMNNLAVEVFAKGPEEDFQVHGHASAMDWDVIYPDENYIFGNFTERLWAYLTIQQLLEKSNTGTQLEKASATAKGLDMSLRYSFVTPLTSMVVTKPETDGTDSSLIADKLTEAQRQRAEAVQLIVLQRRPPIARLKGPSAHAPRSHAQPAVDGDPHFMIELPDSDDALCFNINDKPGTIFNLVREPKSGFFVNGQIIGKKVVASDGNVNTYFGRYGIIHKSHGVRMEVSTQDISVWQDSKQIKLLWSNTASINGTDMNLKLTENCSLIVTLRHSVKFLIVRHTKVWKRHHDQQHYLGFYTLHSHHLARGVHGLLGQFYHGVAFEVTDLHPTETSEQPDATMHVKGQTLTVTRHWQKDFSRDLKNGESVHCWFVCNNGTGLIDGRASDYIVSSLFETEFC